MDVKEIRQHLESSTADIRLLFPGEEPAQFWSRVRASADHQAYIAEIRAEGERLLREPIPELTYTLLTMFEKTGNRLAFERVYFEKRRRLNTMALLSLLEPERADYRSALCDALWSICNEYSWCLSAHLKGSVETDGGQVFTVESPEWSRRERRTSIDLFSAETSFALCEIMLLTADFLPPLLRSRIREEVVQRVLKPYLLHGPYGWETAEHNWSAVCAGSIASAALLLMGDTHSQGETHTLARIVEKALGSMEHYLAGFGDDGACLEGVGYWNYGFGFFVYFADLLAKRTGGGIDLFRREKVRRIAAFQQQAYLDGDLLVNFSDSVPRASVHIGLTHYLARRYPEVAAPPDRLRAPYTEDHCSRWAPAFRNLLWYDPQMKGQSWASGDYYLPDAQWLISRHASEAGRFGFAAKGGHNAEPHNHNDIGQFILTADGEAFVCDLGSGEYTAEYFGPRRYELDCNGSQGHSVPIVDGAHQSEGADRAARGVQHSLDEQADVLECDIAGAYRLPQLRSLIRRLEWRKGELPALVLEDAFVFDAVPESVAERIVTLIEPQPDGAGRLLLQGISGRTLSIRYDERMVQPEVAAHMYRDHFGRDTRWYAVDFIVAKPQKEQRIRLELQFE